MSLMRSFLAIPLPTAARRRLSKLMLAMQKEGARLRWTPEEQLHLTLCFLGDIEDVRTADACRAIERVAEQTESIEAFIAGVGAFPEPAKARVVWAGFQEGFDRLVTLQRSAREALEDEAFPIDRGRFHPHITLGRVPGRRVDYELAQVVERHAEEEISRCVLDELVLYHSHLTKEGPIHTPLGRFPLS